MSTVTGISYENYADKYLAEHYKGTSTRQTSSKSVFSTSSTTNNTCTDGADDGKISLEEGIVSVGKGVLKGGLNMVKGMFTDENGKFSLGQTLKTAAMTALCFVPVVGPAIGIAFGAMGVVQGGKQIISGVSTAMNATTDAEKKDALENIGSGTLTTGLSVLAVKGGASALKNQGSAILKTVNGSEGAVEAATNAGCSETASAIRDIKFGNGTFRENAGQLLNAMKEDGISNAKIAGEAVKKKAEKTLDKAKEIKDEGVTKYAKRKANESSYKSNAKKLATTEGEQAELKSQLDKLEDTSENASARKSLEDKISAKQKTIDKYLEKQGKIDIADETKASLDTQASENYQTQKAKAEAKKAKTESSKAQSEYEAKAKKQAAVEEAQAKLDELEQSKGVNSEEYKAQEKVLDEAKKAQGKSTLNQDEQKVYDAQKEVKKSQSEYSKQQETTEKLRKEAATSDASVDTELAKLEKGEITEADLSTEAKAKYDVQQKAKEAKATQESLTTEKTKLETEVKDLQAKQESLPKEIEEITNQRNEKLKNGSSLNKEMADLKAQKTTLSEEEFNTKKIEIQDRIKEHNKQCAELKKTIESKKAELASAEETLSTKQAKLTQTTSDLEAATTELNNSNEALKNYKSQAQQDYEASKTSTANSKISAKQSEFNSQMESAKFKAQRSNKTITYSEVEGGYQTIETINGKEVTTTYTFDESTGRIKTSTSTSQNGSTQTTIKTLDADGKLVSSETSGKIGIDGGLTGENYTGEMQYGKSTSKADVWKDGKIQSADVETYSIDGTEYRSYRSGEKTTVYEKNTGNGWEAITDEADGKVYLDNAKKANSTTMKLLDKASNWDPFGIFKKKGITNSQLYYGTYALDKNDEELMQAIENAQ